MKEEVNDLTHPLRGQVGIGGTRETPYIIAPFLANRVSLQAAQPLFAGVVVGWWPENAQASSELA
jgi:hypothetical protein